MSGRPARYQSRRARPPFQAAVENPNTSVRAPAIVSARPRISAMMDIGCEWRFMEPEQSNKSVTAHSTAGSSISR